MSGLGVSFLPELCNEVVFIRLQKSMMGNNPVMNDPLSKAWKLPQNTVDL